MLKAPDSFLKKEREDISIESNAGNVDQAEDDSDQIFLLFRAIIG